MGGFVEFKCRYCNYEETDIGVGRGQQAFPYLALFCCDNCKSVGSTWVHENRTPRCGACYHEGVMLLPDNVQHIDCPKCGQPATFSHKEGGWQ